MVGEVHAFKKNISGSNSVNNRVIMKLSRTYSFQRAEFFRKFCLSTGVKLKRGTKANHEIFISNFSLKFDQIGFNTNIHVFLIFFCILNQHTTQEID